MIRVESPGFFTTVQDIGRFGWEQYGLPQSGAMDAQALQSANVLVGNEPNEGALEITVTGPTLVFEAPAVFAVTGADFRMTLDGCDIGSGRACCAKRGSTLRFVSPVSGCRAYLAVAGGFALPKVLGSLSTSARHGLGGFQGRRLEKGDRLPLRKEISALPDMERRVLPAGFFGDPARRVRVILGPQDERFTQAGIRTFLHEAYTVSAASDRMGCRLEGPRIEHRTDGNILSDGIAFGCVQVPTDGRPIIMMADRQTVGGYTKIAAVISADLSCVAQSRAGDRLSFTAVTLEQAQNAERTWRRRLEWLRSFIENGSSGAFPLLVCEYTIEPEKE